MSETAREVAIERLATITGETTPERRRNHAEWIVDAVLAAVREDQAATPPPPGYVRTNGSRIRASEPCGVTSRSGACLKPRGHGQRHRYVVPPTPPPPRDWEPVESARIPGSRYTVSVGSPVKVLGEGRKTEKNPAGSADDGWSVIRMERHRETGKVNVEVKKERTGHGRTFPIEKIVYRRPKAGS